jgi:formimidoylglutamate deiminase
VELLFERALMPAGISREVAVSIAADGTIAEVTAQAARDGRTPIPGLALPGMPNLHSHAFQRGIAGTTERASAANSFWGWREVMYRFVQRLQPADVAAIAAFLYLEMLEAGYTSVAEFHYLHHQPDGTAYLDSASLSNAVREGARQAGIRQLLLPCLYQRSGFDARSPLPEQRRFAQRTESFLQLLDTLQRSAAGLQTTGMALHSLRAVPAASIREVLAAAPPQLPVHIHIAEQRRELEDCLKYLGERPIEALFDTVAVDGRWCLVHATHASAAELQAIVKAGAVVGLCLTTEGNLGDGRFPLDEFAAAGGRFGIGSDSHVSVDPREELRAAEYAVRIWRERRGLVASGALPHCGSFLYSAAGIGGAQALGLAGGALVAGAPADMLVLDTDRAEFAGVTDDALLDAYIFAPRPGAVRDVLVGGEWIVRGGRHPRREAIEQSYRQCLARLQCAPPL